MKFIQYMSIEKETTKVALFVPLVLRYTGTWFREYGVHDFGGTGVWGT